MPSNLDIQDRLTPCLPLVTGHLAAKWGRMRHQISHLAPEPCHIPAFSPTFSPLKKMWVMYSPEGEGLGVRARNRINKSLT